jgi:hypothetical protein
VVIPEIGMAFESEEDAYDMYNTYAGKVGFSIKKHDTKRRADKSIYSKVFACSNQGFADNSSSQTTTRTGCRARIQFSISREGVWTVQKIESEHNII